MKSSKFFFSFFVLSVFILGSFYMSPAIAGNITSNTNTDSSISDDGDINFIVLWPLDANFKIVQFNISSCTLYPYLKNRLIGYYVNSTEALEIMANVYIGCPNVSGMKVEVLSPKITRKGENFRYVTVPVNVYTNLPFPYPVELRSSNVSISYEYHNSTHFFLVIKMLNITVSPELRDTFGTSDPAHFGWPGNMTIRFLVNRGTGEAYLIDGEEKRYVGTLPLYLPEFNPRRYLQTIKENAFNFVQSVKSNPWAIREIVERARLANSTLERDKIISGAVMNLSERILHVNHRYLGLPIKIKSNTIVSPAVDMWRNTTKPRANISAIISPRIQNLTKKAVLEYLESGNESGIIGVVNQTLYMKKSFIPPIATNVFMSVDIPVNTSDFLPLPLPEEYGEKLGARYIFVLLLRNAEKYPYIHYDRRIFDPDKISEEWKNLTLFLSLLRSKVYNELSEALYPSVPSGEVNYTKFDRLYKDVSSMIGEYLKEVYGAALDSEPSSPTGAEERETSNHEPNTSTMTNKGHICGPAFLVPLALIPAWLWRKRR